VELVLNSFEQAIFFVSVVALINIFFVLGIFSLHLFGTNLLRGGLSVSKSRALFAPR
jgi:hypothetical protein